ncbi:hypothetical protein [Euzebya tangerina]|uniref:hypothetical protein n=1 Tax=Euzebya tangerina TaxID=591198 RepID=UPI000E316196|nr:hypothetical protein [Euzebya tangerina]
MNIRLPTLNRRRTARLFIIGLGVARLVEGTAATISPGPVLDIIGDDISTADSRASFRMKSGRDVALGLMTLKAMRDDRRLAELALASVVVDAVDGLAVTLDGRDAFGAPVYPAGAVLGFAVAGAAAWSARALRRL